MLHEKSCSRQVPIRIYLRIFHALKIFALNERFDTFLDHIDLGLELSSQLAKSFRDKLLMRELFALSSVLLA